MSNIGPALPPHLQKKRAATPDSEPESGPQPKARSRSPSPDQAGPALPPHILAARRAKAQAQASSSSSSSSSAPVASASIESKKTYGPMLPGSSASATATAPTLAPALPQRPAYAGYEDDDDDDDVGPRPEMAYRGDQPGDAVREFLEREERVNKLREVRLRLRLASFSSFWSRAYYAYLWLRCRKLKSPKSCNGKNGCSTPRKPLICFRVSPRRIAPCYRFNPMTY